MKLFKVTIFNVVGESIDYNIVAADEVGAREVSIRLHKEINPKLGLDYCEIVMLNRIDGFQER